MIWNEELSASLDQSAGVVVFHRIELSRAQQLAQTVADKVGTMVDQSEKTLDLKLGGTGGWNDRADNKGEKRGEQAQGERRGRGERTRGARGKCYFNLSIYVHTLMDFRLGGARGGRGSRFAQGLGNQMPGQVSQRA